MLVDWIWLADLFCIEFALNLLVAFNISHSFVFELFTAFTCSQFCFCEILSTFLRSRPWCHDAQNAWIRLGLRVHVCFGHWWIVLCTVIGYKQTSILVYWVNYILKSYLNIRSIIWSHINQHHINITVTVCRTNTNFLKVSSFLHLQQVVELQHISQSLQGFAVWRCWLHEQQAIFMQVPQVGVLRHVRVRRLLQVFHHFVNFDFHQIRSKGLHQHDAIVKPPCFCYINCFRLFELFELREGVIGKHSATTFDKSLTTKS